MKPYLILVFIAITTPAIASWESDLTAAWKLEPKASARAELMRLAGTTNGVASVDAKRMAAAKADSIQVTMSELKALFPDRSAKAAWVSTGLRYGGLTLDEVSSTLNEVLVSGLDGANLANMQSYVLVASLKEGKWALARTTCQQLASSKPAYLAPHWTKFVQAGPSLFATKEEQIVFYNDLLRTIPAVDANAKLLGMIKSQLELLK